MDRGNRNRRVLGACLALAVGTWLLTGAPAARAGTLVEAIPGNVNQVDDLLLFDAIDSVEHLVLLGVYDDREQTPGFSFPDGSPFDRDAGRIVWSGDAPTWYTVKASNVTALYRWMPSGDNPFDTTGFAGGRGFSNVRVWGGPGGAVPEPGAALAFGSALLAAAATLRRAPR